MFSGFVVVGMLTAFGRSTFTVRVMTGIVIRKMMSRTSMTSTRGVVLIVAIMAGPSEDGEPTCIDILAYLWGFGRRAPRMGECRLVTCAAPRPAQPPDECHPFRCCRRAHRRRDTHADRLRSCAANPADSCCGLGASCSP